MRRTIRSGVVRWGAAGVTCGGLLLAGGCGSSVDTSAPAVEGPPTTASWRAARAKLAGLRRRYGVPEAYTMTLALRLSEPRTGQRVRARGAAAVSRADDGLRMILLGPGGTTALDLWLCRDRYRFALPTIDLVRRGDARSPAADRRSLPVDFLRWWLLRPLDGRLLHHDVQAGQERFVLRHGDAIVDMRLSTDGALAVERRSPGELERVTTPGPGCQTIRYWQRSTGIDITVDCERLDRHRLPKQNAFDDPDPPHDACREPQGSST